MKKRFYQVPRHYMSGLLNIIYPGNNFYFRLISPSNPMLFLPIPLIYEA